MNDLRVESYDAKEVADKKRSISKRAVVAGCAIVLALGVFSLVGCDSDEEYDENRGRDEERYFVLGGSGSWFVSIVERV